jgi:hypothetical protein
VALEVIQEDFTWRACGPTVSFSALAAGRSQASLALYTESFASALQLVYAVGTLGFAAHWPLVARVTNALAFDTYAVFAALGTLLGGTVIASEAVQTLAGSRQRIAGAVSALLWAALVLADVACPPFLALARAVQALPPLVTVQLTGPEAARQPREARSARTQARFGVALTLVGTVSRAWDRIAVDSSSTMLTVASSFVADAQSAAVVGTHFGFAEVSSESFVTLARSSWLAGAMTRTVLDAFGRSAVQPRPVIVALARPVVAVSITATVLGTHLLAAVLPPVSSEAEALWVGGICLVTGTILITVVRTLLYGTVKAFEVAHAVALPVGCVAVSMARTVVGAGFDAAVVSLEARVTLAVTSIYAEAVVVTEIFA